MAADGVVVLDSTFLVAYHNTRDVHHAAAARAMDEIVAGRWGRALLLEYVFLEVVTVLLARRGRETAARVSAVLLAAREVDFVLCSERFEAALDTFLEQRSGALSFTDAAIVAVAREHPGARIATFDPDLARESGAAVVPG